VLCLLHIHIIKAHSGRSLGRSLPVLPLLYVVGAVKVVGEMRGKGRATEMAGGGQRGVRGRKEGAPA